MVTKAAFKPAPKKQPFRGQPNRGGGAVVAKRPIQQSRPVPVPSVRRFGGGGASAIRRVPPTVNRGPPRAPPGAAGGWVWLPAGQPLPTVPVRNRGPVVAPFMAKGKGKVMAKSKGKGTGAVKSDKHLEKLRSFEVAKKAWVGGLDKKTTWKQLAKHFKDADLKPALVDVNERKGTAVVCFNDEDDVHTAVAALNGSELDGKTIEVDVWEKKPPKEDGEDKPKRKSRPKPKMKVSLKVPIKNMLKGKKPLSKIGEKLKGISADLKIWVGGVKEGATFKELSKHFEEQYSKPDLIEILPKGRAVVTYKEADDVQTAIGIVNGSEFKGKTLEVDVWTKPERKEKVKKEKEA